MYTKMLTDLIGVLGTSLLVSFTSAPAIAATPATCPLEDSVYQDANGRGFVLSFDGPNADLSLIAPLTAAIHYQATPLYHFPITLSNGYVSYYWLVENDALRMDFFNADLTAFDALTTTTAPAIAFISGLGSYDYYTRRGDQTETSPPLILDTLWIFDHCTEESLHS